MASLCSLVCSGIGYVVIPPGEQMERLSFSGTSASTSLIPNRRTYLSSFPAAITVFFLLLF
jgi:hypothetical protein